MLTVGQTIRVWKLKLGVEPRSVSYDTTVVDVTPAGVVVAAELSVGEFVVDGVAITWGDRFTEYYYRDRWFNVLHVASPTGEPKGWYCNVAFPAQIEDSGISFLDLELDLFVHPDGRATVLDEDEFAELDLPPNEQQKARSALTELLELASRDALPRPTNSASSPAPRI
ncbi:MAG: DUF402 domain-containing protein [Chloroflexi bacterium]|nr:DUF402 domain-containing protein [Chloroflexota bacterium]